MLMMARIRVMSSGLRLRNRIRTSDRSSARRSGSCAGREARVAGAEVVEGQHDAQLDQAFERMPDALVLIQQHAFGDFDLQPRVAQPVAARVSRT